ncbi:efflux transporter outer membrane subunit [Hymenobacter sp. BT559]|nr:efflux transporter outer membrane subunit [Hymenobacter sp. BT559]MBJ6142256.1 efflux transporter outer membrane subunit [Hymenobacter sp. BT559]
MSLTRFFAFIFCKPKVVRLPSPGGEGPGVGSYARRALTVAAGIFLFSACQLSDPRSYPAATPLPGTYGYPAPNDSTSIGDLAWNQFFADKTLIGLIDTALQQNLDLRQASQRVEQARAAVLERRGALLPSVNATGTAGFDRYGRYTLTGVGNYDTNLSQNIDASQVVPTGFTPDYFLGLRSTWEVDLWGRLRSLRNAAQGRLLASEQGRQLVVTSVIAEVANNYYELLTLDNQLATLQRNLVLQERALEITKVQKLAGRATELAVQQFQAQVLRTRSLAYETKQRIVENETQLNQLMGRYPRRIARPAELAEVQVPKRLLAGVPARLVLRRPDVRQAEFNLSANGADLYAARAAFLPALTLTPYVGVNAFRSSLLFQPSSVVAGILGGLSAPILNRRALRAERNRATAASLETYYAYQQTLQTSVREVTNTLRGVANYDSALTLRRQEVITLRKAVETATDLQYTGYATYLEIITAQRSVLDAELSLAELRRTQLLQAVALYRALGGGWNTPVPQQ